MAPVSIAVGLKETPRTKKGFSTTKRELRAKPSHSKGKLSERKRFARDIIREVAGFAPYERRILELLRLSKDKRALKVAKARLGTHKRGKAKREEMTNVLAAQRKAHHH